MIVKFYKKRDQIELEVKNMKFQTLNPRKELLSNKDHGINSFFTKIHNSFSKFDKNVIFCLIIQYSRLLIFTLFYLLSLRQILTHMIQYLIQIDFVI
jgi:hypothetical protein